MAVGTGGRVAFAGGQCLPVGAHRPVLGFPIVAGAAGFGQMRIAQWRIRRIGRDNFMGIVAIRAGGRRDLPGLPGQTVNARIVTVRLARMANGAVDRFQHDVVVRMFRRCIGMATDAGIGFVDGRLEPGFIHEQVNRAASGVRGREGLVQMTIQAIAVLKLRTGRQGGNRQYKRKAP